MEISKKIIDVADELTFMGVSGEAQVVSKGVVQETRIPKIEVDGKIYYPMLPTYAATLYTSTGDQGDGRLDFYSFDSENNLCGVCTKIEANDPNIYCVAPEQLSAISERANTGKKPQKVKFGFSVKTDNSHKGVFVFNAEEGSLAEKCGLRMGDTIVEVDGGRILNIAEFASKIGYSLPPSGLHFGVIRDDKYTQLDACKE